MDRVTQEVVVRHWLKKGRPGSGDGDPSSLTKAEAYDELTREYPGETAVLWGEGSVDWYRTTMPLAEFKRLRLSRSPRYAHLRELSADGTVWDCANAIYEGRPGSLDDPAGRPLDRVLELATEYPFDGPESIVATTRRGCSPLRIVMGGERAVAIGLAVRYDKPFDPLLAYVGVTPNPVLRPAWERTCGLARRLGIRPPPWRSGSSIGGRMSSVRDRAASIRDRAAALRDRAASVRDRA